ncbi:hypothetical protein MNBD_GAMMA26-966 [hydrothermal vent metagenome]|uniref:Uncharacterized protein n=1 Tax=hydrothermal vent metagenome TaxID=652676 RepID=A0A3B1AR40_9ZZZZ
MTDNDKQSNQLNLWVASIAVAMIAGSTAHALPTGEQEAIPIGGGAYLYPTIGVNVKYSDNIFLQDNDEKSSLITVISPGARLELNGEITEIALDFKADYGTYDNSHADDYIDSKTTLSVSIYPTERIAFFGELSYQEGHDARGTYGQEGGAATNSSSPDEHNTLEISGGVKYGVDQVGAPQLEIGVSRSDRAFENNRASTRTRDLEKDRLNATLSYRIMPSTSLVLEGVATDIDYDRAVRDSKQYSLLAGITWEATYQTEGYLKLGRERKDFDSSTIRDDSSMAWAVGVNWQPLSYSTVIFETSKGFGESSGTGSFIEGTATSLTWEHDWNSFLGSSLALSAGTDEYASNPREDDMLEFKASLEYLMHPSLRVGAGYAYSERDSNSAGLDYDLNIIEAYVIVN